MRTAIAAHVVSNVPIKVVTIAKMKIRKVGRKYSTPTTPNSPSSSQPAKAKTPLLLPSTFSFNKSSISLMQPFIGSTQQPKASTEQHRPDNSTPMQETQSDNPNRVRSESDASQEGSSPDDKRFKPSSMELVLYQSTPADPTHLADSSNASRFAIDTPRL